MDAQALFAEFIGSEHGQGAAQALAAQGISPDDAQSYLAHATEVGHAHVEDHAGLLGEHPGRSFFAAFAAGIVKGDGILGALGDGLEGVLTGRVAEAVAEKFGIDPGTASSVAAAATPYLAAFLKSKLSS